MSTEIPEGGWSSWIARCENERVVPLASQMEWPCEAKLRNGTVSESERACRFDWAITGGLADIVEFRVKRPPPEDGAGWIHRDADRQAVYGHPADDYARTAAMWSAYLGVEVTALQAQMCMVLVKVSRLANTPTHRDLLVDIAGYARTYEMTLEKQP